MNKLNIILLLILPLFTYAQEDTDDGLIVSPQSATSTLTTIDNRYLEDQFYVGLTYDYLAGKASSVVQHNLSHGIHLGFIRDLPINQKRNLGFGIGIGYAYDVVYFKTHAIEIPVEFRFRTSNPTSHKFWRVYAGMRFSYLVGGRSLYTANDIDTSFQNPDIAKKFQLKTFAAFGYNALNFFVQYNLSPLLKDVKTTDGTSLSSNVLQIGLIFYIL